MTYNPSSYDATRDGNRIPVAMGQSNADATQTLPFLCDHVTGRLLTDSTGNGGTLVNNEIVAGSGTTFTLAHTPIAGTEQIYERGQRIFPTTGYTIAGAVITTVDSLSAGDIAATYQM